MKKIYYIINEMEKKNKCFACGKKMGAKFLVDTHDDQFPYVGPECYKKVIRAGVRGYQPPLGCPKLFSMTDKSYKRYKEIIG